MAKATEGLALWALPREREGGNPLVEVHFNYWRLSPEKRFVVFGRRADLLEIGLMLSQPGSFEVVNFYLPFIVTRSDLSDLGEHFGDNDLAQAIFNEAFSSGVHDGRERWIDLKKGDSLFCRVRRFAANDGIIDSDQLIVRHVNGGTLISLTRSAIDQSTEGLAVGDRLYFRIRINIGKKKRNTFVDVISPWDRHFQSGFDEVEIVNFRVNEARTLPNSIETIIRDDQNRAGKIPVFRLVFLTAVPIVSGISVSHPAAYKSRLLESDIWKSYVPSGTPRRMMVYHWRLPATEQEPANDPIEDVGDFAALVKLQTRRSGPIVLLVYLAIALAFGFVGNLAASRFEREMHWDGGEKTEPTGVTAAKGTAGSNGTNKAAGADKPAGQKSEGQ